MTSEATLETLDRDEAVAEAAAELRHPTRRGVLRRLGLVAGGGVVAGALPLGRATGRSGPLAKRDVEILNYALTLEHLQSAFYAEALEKGRLTGAAQAFATTLARQEATHVAALKQALDGRAAKKPTFDFQQTTSDTESFLSTAKTLEDLGVSAYQGQAGRISSKAVLATAGSILAVEARHSAWVRYLIDDGEQDEPAPDAFSVAVSMGVVASAVKSTGFVKD